MYIYKFYYVLVYLTINDNKKKKSPCNSRYDNYNLRPVGVGRFDGVKNQIINQLKIIMIWKIFKCLFHIITTFYI